MIKKKCRERNKNPPTVPHSSTAAMHNRPTLISIFSLTSASGSSFPLPLHFFNFSLIFPNKTTLQTLSKTSISRYIVLIKLRPNNKLTPQRRRGSLV
ncbi:hypothetical protein LguiA_001273 [Lonicera macranthoides]